MLATKRPAGEQNYIVDGYQDVMRSAISLPKPIIMLHILSISSMLEDFGQEVDLIGGEDGSSHSLFWTRFKYVPMGNIKKIKQIISDFTIIYNHFVKLVRTLKKYLYYFLQGRECGFCWWSLWLHLSAPWQALFSCLSTENDYVQFSYHYFNKNMKKNLLRITMTSILPEKKAPFFIKKMKQTTSNFLMPVYFYYD